MPLMEWNQKMAVGVAILDADHQKLVQLINDLYDAMKEGHSEETLGSILDRLVEYTKFHFVHEERFFSQTEYPGAAARKREHDALTKQVLEVQTRYKGGAYGTLSLDVMNFLKERLVNHIQGSDKKYGPRLNGAGIY
ncbi:MAG TPA: bacteriohemerythrin [Methylomirabilota bacterium]|nr:bacteriohemerythrin [Methylomirabilota bacterium]